MFNYTPTSLELMFWEAVALIVAACIFAPLFRRLGLGTVLGYLAAGLAVQASLQLSFSDHPEDLLHFAEFGVVLFLFIIGLELKPSELWRMRGDIVGLGLTQMLTCGAAITGGALMFGLSVPVALVIGFGLALSSTALVMKLLDERNERGTPYGRKSFSILLLQDLAIVPLLLMVAILAPSGEAMTLTSALTQAGVAIAAIAAVILAGRFLLNPMFHLLAQARMTEIMTAGALGVVILAGLVMDMAGMSYAMGAFLAGVLLADSRFRHELEANVEPFRGLFMGLFFMAVGLSLDLGAVAENWIIILLAAPALMAVKGAIIYLIMRIRGNPRPTAARTSLTLSQSGEFGFVLFAAATTVGLLDESLAAILISIITLSMALTPIVGRLESLLVGRPDEVDESHEENFDDAQGHVLVIGFGRFGQILSQPLFAEGIDTTILDNSPQSIRNAESFGFRIHYGDGTRRDVLRASGVEKVSAVFICLGNPDVASTVVERVREVAPEAKIFIRSRDRRHSIELIKKNVDYTVRETFESALAMGRNALIALGRDEAAAQATVDDIRRRDRERLDEQVKGDMRSGMDRLHTRAVKPEPLVIAPEEE